MSAAHLINFFSNFECIPSIKDISEQVTEMGVIDKITFFPFEEDPGVLLGMLVRWSQKYPYGAETYHSAVCYNKTVPPWLQNVICCKEILHIFDAPDIITDTRELVEELLSRLFNGDGPFIVGPSVVELANVFDLQGFYDELAVLQAFSIVFPKGLLDKILNELDGSEIDMEEAAKKLCVPASFAGFLLSPKWIKTRARILTLSK